MQLNEEEQKSFEDEDRSEPIPPGDVVAYNELRSCADLYRLYSSGKLEIQPDFQREVVWKKDEQTRFIDSLAKSLPIPSMCFSLDYKTQRWKVIDGLQRMSSIIRFLSDEKWVLSSLDDIREELRGATNSDLRLARTNFNHLYSIIEDVSIPITVIRCDYTKTSHMQYLFTIFHRLNSGGVRLTNQEIRNCIFTGPFNDFLKNFDAHNKSWKNVRKRIWGSVDRFRSVEVLLRVLAFGEQSQIYDGNLAHFLNLYMQDHADANDSVLSAFEKRLDATASCAEEALGAESAKKISLATIESLLVAIYNTQAVSRSSNSQDLQLRYSSMKANPIFASGARYAISSAENVRRRLTEATFAFAY